MKRLAVTLMRCYGVDRDDGRNCVLHQGDSEERLLRTARETGKFSENETFPVSYSYYSQRMRCCRHEHPDAVMATIETDHRTQGIMTRWSRSLREN